jgi:hypothetical protein
MYCLFCVVLCIFVLFYVLFVLCRSLYCFCVHVYCYYCHRVANQLQFNISYISDKSSPNSHTMYLDPLNIIPRLRLGLPSYSSFSRFKLKFCMLLFSNKQMLHVPPAIFFPFCHSLTFLFYSTSFNSLLHHSIPFYFKLLYLSMYYYSIIPSFFTSE